MNRQFRIILHRWESDWLYDLQVYSPTDSVWMTTITGRTIHHIYQFCDDNRIERPKTVMQCIHR